MSDLNIGSMKIPINGATKTFAILAKRGAGKSYTGAVMAERSFLLVKDTLTINPGTV